jgi:hypothetical protein
MTTTLTSILDQKLLPTLRRSLPFYVFAPLCNLMCLHDCWCLPSQYQQWNCAHPPSQFYKKGF